MEIDPALEFAARYNRGVMLTLKRDGRPQASNVNYAVLDGAIHVSVTEGRAKTNNLRRDPRGALHVSSDDFWSWVVLEGNAEMSSIPARPEDDAAAFLRRVYEEAAGKPHPDWDEFDQAMISDRRLIISLRIERAYGELR